jgi:hypothetical protein
VTDGRPTRLLAIRDRRALLERQQELADAATAIDVEQQRLAVELTRLRRELVAIREQLWPPGPGRGFQNASRPRVAGPTAVPPPVPDATAVRGRALRDAALRVLLRADGPLTLSEIHRALHLGGLVLLATRSGEARLDASLGEPT